MRRSVDCCDERDAESQQRAPADRLGIVDQNALPQLDRHVLPSTIRWLATALFAWRPTWMLMQQGDTLELHARKRGEARLFSFTGDWLAWIRKGHEPGDDGNQPLPLPGSLSQVACPSCLGYPRLAECLPQFT